LASSAWAADEAADRAAIEKVISTLNNSPNSPGLFTEDFGDNAILAALDVYRKTQPAAIRQDSIPLNVPCYAPEVWPELGCPFQTKPGGQSAAGLPAPPSHFVIQSIRLLTPGVALVDAVNERGGALRHSPVLLVLSKDGDVWRIASLRVMARLEPVLVQ
jgi:hypothetical protein